MTYYKLKSSCDTPVLLGCLLAFLLLSCSRTQEGYTDSLDCPVAGELHFQVLNDSFPLAYPSDIFVIGNTLVVADAECGDNLFYVFDKESGEFIKGGGKKGEGPGEVISPAFNAHPDHRGGISYWDKAKSKVFLYQIDSLLSGATDYVTEIPLPRISNLVKNDALTLSDGVLYTNLFPLGETEEKIFLAKSGSNASVPCPTVPEIASEEEGWNIMAQAHWEVSPDEKHLVLATSIGGIVQGYALDGSNDPQAIFSRHYFKPIYDLAQGTVPAWVIWTDDTRLGFWDISLSNRYAYLLFDGKVAKDNQEGIVNEVRIMDMEGHWAGKWILDKSVHCIAVDEEGKKLYAVGQEAEGEPQLLVASWKDSL